jgi:hypothetical protein
MIINRNFKNSQKTEKAAALLALAADNEGEHGRCLSPEEIAALVDTSCGKEELAIFMEHLSYCETCYEEWLILKKMDDHNLNIPNKGRVYHLSKFKKYRFIGSALAVAASVVVFLNISHQPSSFKERSFQEAVLIPPEGESNKSLVPQFKLESEANDLEAERETAVPADQVVKEALQEELYEGLERLERVGIHEKKEIPTESRDATRQTIKGMSAPAAQSVPQAKHRMAKKSDSIKVVGESDTQKDFDSWLEQLQKNCLADRQEADFWQILHLRGKELLVKQAGLLPEEKEQKVSAALALLAGMERESVTDQCRQLLAILAEEEKSR